MLEAGFILLSLAVVALFVAASREHRRTAVIVAAVWLGVPAILAALGVTAFPEDGGFPPLMPVVLLSFVGSIALVRSRLGAALAARPLAMLVGFQGFRILVELLLHRAHVQGFIPERMTYLGWNFDVVTGVLGVALIPVLRGAPSATKRRIAIAFNVVGLGLLATIVVIAVLSMPGPLNGFADGIPNTFVGRFPFIWLPTILVQAALVGHLLVFRHSMTPLPRATVAHAPAEG